MDFYKREDPDGYGTPAGDAVYGSDLEGEPICGVFCFSKDEQGAEAAHYMAVEQCHDDEAEFRIPLEPTTCILSTVRSPQQLAMEEDYDGSPKPNANVIASLEANQHVARSLDSVYDLQDYRHLTPPHSPPTPPPLQICDGVASPAQADSARKRCHVEAEQTTRLSAANQGWVDGLSEAIGLGDSIMPPYNPQEFSEDDAMKENAIEDGRMVVASDDDGLGDALGEQMAPEDTVEAPCDEVLKPIQRRMYEEDTPKRLQSLQNGSPARAMRRVLWPGISPGTPEGVLRPPTIYTYQVCFRENKLSQRKHIYNYQQHNSLRIFCPGSSPGRYAELSGPSLGFSPGSTYIYIYIYIYIVLALAPSSSGLLALALSSMNIYIYIYISSLPEGKQAFPTETHIYIYIYIFNHHQQNTLRIFCPGPSPGLYICRAHWP